MKDDITQQTKQETDELVERIFSEWDQWIDDPVDQRKEDLRDKQNELRELYESYHQQLVLDDRDEDKLAELREQMTVLDKKMRKAQRELVKDLQENSTKVP